MVVIGSFVPLRHRVPLAGLFTVVALAVLASAPRAHAMPSMLDIPASQITAGDGHTCALTTQNGVKCWGQNQRGQLGDGGTVERLLAVNVAGLTSGVVAVAARGSHTCALTMAGGVKCWGHNVNGQLGDGSTVQRNAPVDVSGLSSGVAAIVNGVNHSCALSTAGGVTCWGYNAYGQLGDGTTTQRATPVNVRGLETGVVALAAGIGHTCALTHAGAIKCWGYNLNGQLGDGSTTNRTTPVTVVGMGSGVTRMATGNNHGCAVSTDGATKCWGWNNHGQLGSGVFGMSSVPVAVPGLSSGLAALSGGGAHTCALTTGGGMRCWGLNEAGQLGDGTTVSRSAPVDVTGLSAGIAAIASGSQHSCALSMGGGVLCWGRNVNGQLGDGTTANRAAPVDVSGLAAGVAALALGGAHVCALTSAGGVKCWGYNGQGQLGDNSWMDRPTPVDVVGLTSGVRAIAAGNWYTCALTTAGGVKCWGSNGAGQLGDGTSNTRRTPADVSGLTSGVAALAAGGAHACALMTAGGIKCWGDNAHGQLGNGTETDSPVPVPVSVNLSGLPAGESVVALAAGAAHTCLVARPPGNSSGRAMCWGNNDSGQLGDGTTTDRTTPVQVYGLGANVSSITANDRHTCVRMAIGGNPPRCWGYNGNASDGTNPPLPPPDRRGKCCVLPAYRSAPDLVPHASGGDGRLGDGTDINRPTPVSVVDLPSGVSWIESGAHHTCAITTEGGAKCWGRNDDGQLGNGQQGTRITRPADVSGLTSGASAIATSSWRDHACALTTAKGLKCWGFNKEGQIGTGVAGEDKRSLVPLTVRGGQALTFAPGTLGTGPIATIAPGVLSMPLLASSSGEGDVPIVFASWTPDICTVSGNTLSILRWGLCGVYASRGGGADAAGAVGGMLDDAPVGTLAPAPVQYRLLRIPRSDAMNVRVVGEGSVAVSPRPAGSAILDCTPMTSPCTWTYLDGDAMALTLAATAGTGWRVAGWEDNCTAATSDQSQATVTLRGDKACTANFLISQFTVAFDAQGGDPVASITQDYGTTITLPSTTRAGHSLGGWNTVADGSGTGHAAGSAFTVPAANTTLHAQWTINQYTVTFLDWDDTVIAIRSVNHGSAATAPVPPARPDYTFIGWDAEFAPVFSDLTVKALYRPSVFDAAIHKIVTHSLSLLDGIGDLVRYEILVENLGKDPLVGARVLDLMPDVFGQVLWTCAGSAGGQCESPSGEGGIDATVHLPVGASVRYFVEGVASPVPEQGLIATAIVHVEADIDTSNNVASVLYQRCGAMNVQINEEDTALLPHPCVFRDGYEPP